jgi:arsenite methyltransferase
VSGPIRSLGGVTPRQHQSAFVIFNCVINLSVAKPAVLTETYCVLTPGGRIGISDVIADEDLTTEERAECGSYVG